MCYLVAIPDTAALGVIVGTSAGAVGAETAGQSALFTYQAAAGSAGPEVSFLQPTPRNSCGRQ